MPDQQPSELHVKGGSTILTYLRQFSATEKAIFGVLAILACITAIIMANRISETFSVVIPARGGTLREGIVGLPHNVNPIIAITDIDKDITSLVYSGLMKYSNGTVIPDLAASYTISDDGLIYTFTLKPDITFQDGTVLSADDVIYTIQKIQDPAIKSPRSGDWANVTAKKLAANKVQINLRQAYAPFLNNMTIGILPKHIWSSVSDEQFIFSQYNIEPIGSGPYRITSISRDNGGIPTEYHLSTWRGYYGVIPRLDNLAFTFFADEENALSALDSGSIDSLASVSPVEAARLAQDSAQAYRVLSTPLPRIFGVFFNQTQAPVLANLEVRQALDMAVDRGTIVKTVLSGYGIPLRSPLPPGLVITPTSTLQISPKASTSTAATSTVSIAAARTLLEKNGWKRNAAGIYEKKIKNAVVTLKFDMYTADSGDLKQAAELVRKNWNDLGAQVGIKVFDASDLYQNVIRSRKYDALLFGQFIGKDRDLYAFWHSSQRAAPRLNVSNYANPAADKLLEDMRVAVTEKDRITDYIQLDKIIRADIPAVFLYAPNFIYVVPKSVRGISLVSVTVPADRWSSLKNWYVTTEKVWKIFDTTNK